MSQATLNGQVVDDGGLTCEVRFEWGTSTDYGKETPWQGGFTTGMTFSAVLSNLGEGVLYHYRAVVRNATGTVYGNDMAFVTLVGTTIPLLIDDAALVGFLGA